MKNLCKLVFVSLMGVFLVACESKTEPKMMYEGQEYVDLGLSVMWANYNVGATAPEETYVKVEDMTLEYNREGNYDKLKAIMDSNWEGDWRLPSADDMQELVKFCDVTMTIKNRVYGYEFVSKINGNSIFMPLWPTPEPYHPLDAPQAPYLNSEVDYETSETGEVTVYHGGIAFADDRYHIFYPADPSFKGVRTFEARMVFKP